MITKWLAGATCAFGFMAILPAQAQTTTPGLLWGLDMVGASYAHQRGFTGAGVAVGVMDDGTQPDHPQYADRWMGGFNVDGSPYGPWDEHGTHVAGTVAGRTTGVAPGSQLYAMNWSVAPVAAGMVNGYLWAEEQGARFVNSSWGPVVVLPGGRRRTQLITEIVPETFIAEWADLIEAFNATTQAGMVHVFSTGNSGFNQPSAMAGLPYYLPQLGPNWLAVTSVGPSGAIADYADQCGVAAIWCLAAPGGLGAQGSDDSIWSSWPGSLYESIDGTSMAAPHVTGALAVAAQIYPSASGTELVQLVLQTAADTGAPGIDPVYGWGLLRVDNIAASADPVTAGSFANAAWSRFSTLRHVGQALRRHDAAAPAQEMGEGDTFLSSAWGQWVYGAATLAAGATSTDAKHISSGFLLGANILRNADYSVGLAGGYTNGRMVSRGAKDRASAGNYHLALHGAWQDGAWSVQGTLQGAFIQQTVVRHAIAGAAGTSVTPAGRTALGGTGIEASLGVGHTFALGEGWHVTPRLTLSALWQDVNGARESGANIFNLKLPSAQHYQVEAGPGIGWRAPVIAIEEMSLQIGGEIGYARLFGNTDHRLTAQLLGRNIETRSAALGQDTLRLGLNLDLAVMEGFSLFVGYDGAFQSRAESHAVTGGIRVGL